MAICKDGLSNEEKNYFKVTVAAVYSTDTVTRIYVMLDISKIIKCYKETLL